MNRKIKFRVWDKKNKILTKFGKGIGYIGFIIYMDGTIRREIINSSFDGLDRNTTEEQDNYVIQQFTGLNDSKGKETYEGDIVKVKFNKLGEHICQIKYDIMGFKFFMLKDEILSFPIILNDMFYYVEVIGNILENEILNNG